MGYLVTGDLAGRVDVFGQKLDGKIFNGRRDRSRFSLGWGGSDSGICGRVNNRTIGLGHGRASVSRRP